MTTVQAPASLLCPICGKNDHVITVGQGVRDAPQEYVYGCNRCMHQFLRPETAADLRAYYQNGYRKEHSYAWGKTQTPQEEFDMMRPLVDDRENFFREFVPEGAKVLEIGCSSGFFLDRLRKDYTVYGNEWNPEAADFVENTLRIPCSAETLENAFPGEQFTVICAYHVLEHQADPVAWLRLIKERLIGGGWVIFDTPNLNNALLEIYQAPGFTDFFYRKPHVQYFTRFSLAALLDKLGFEGRVQQRERYSMANHLWWHFNGRPMENATVAMGGPRPIPDSHPASNVINRFFGRVDREYRAILDTLTACDTLCAVARKREI